MSDGVKPTRIEDEGYALPDVVSIDGDYTGDDVDFDGDVLASGYELSTEGGQSVISAHGSMGATETFDPTDGNVHTGTLNANCTFTLNAPTGSGAATLELVLTQDGTGGWTITWPGSVTLVGTLDTTASTVSRVILETVDGGTSWVAYVVGGGGSSLTVKDEGSGLDTAVTSIDFTGGGVTVTHVGHAVTVDIPASSSAAAGHVHVVSETHLSNGSATAYTLDQAFEPGSVIAWNTTTLARLDVTEVQPDQATVSAAGSSGDKIVFDYAATLA